MLQEPKKVEKKKVATTEKAFPFVLPEEQPGPSGVTPTKKQPVPVKKLTPSKSGKEYILKYQTWRWNVIICREEVEQKVYGGKISWVEEKGEAERRRIPTQKEEDEAQRKGWGANDAGGAFGRS
jgi:hypothetical protein